MTLTHAEHVAVELSDVPRFPIDTQDQRLAERAIATLLEMGWTPPAPGDVAAPVAPAQAVDVSALTAERDKLAAFKAFVHHRLDQANVPTDPPGEHRDRGCRIGQRLTWVLDRMAPAPTCGISEASLHAVQYALSFACAELTGVADPSPATQERLSRIRAARAELSALPVVEMMPTISSAVYDVLGQALDCYAEHIGSRPLGILMAEQELKALRALPLVGGGTT